MEAYLDNSATTRVDAQVMELMQQVFGTDYGNPSSRHNKGMQAEQYIRTAKEQIAATLKCKPEEILFTSGGTESNNMAIIGTALANKRRGMHVITTSYEHASVYQPFFFLEEMGFEVTFLAPEADGSISPQKVAEALRPDTILVSVMAVNNEVGAVNDITAIGEAVKSYAPEIVYHVDAIQAYGKFTIIPKRQYIDLLSVSAHKLHGPKGCGFLYIKEKTKIRPIIHGGGQQKGMRSGTENVPGIAGTGLAAKLAYERLDEVVEQMYRRKEHFVDALAALPGTTVHLVDAPNGDKAASELAHTRLRALAPHIVSVGFAGVRAEVLLHALEERGIYVSSGSACSSNHPAVSGTLKAIGVRQELLDSTVRFSFCAETTEEELDYTVQVLSELLPMLRRFVRK